MVPYVETLRDESSYGFDDEALPYVQNAFVELQLPYMSVIED